MSPRSFKRKQFLIFAASAACTAVACAEGDPAPDEGISGSGRGGTAGSAGSAGSSTGGSVSGSAGRGTAGGANGGSSAGSGGSSGSAGVSGRGGGGGAGGSGGGASGSANESGAGGEAGMGGEGGSGSSEMCEAITTFRQTSNNIHDHIPEAMAPLNMLRMNLRSFVNGATVMAEFTLPVDGGGAGHVHKFRLTAQQIATLKGGGTVSGVKTYDTTPGEQQHATGHTHTYSITCVG